jgi:hypothetical protein
MTKKDVVSVAKELNKVLGLSPQIDTKQDLETLKDLVLQAADLIEPEDEISEKTTKIIEELREEKAAAEPEEEDEGEPEEDTDDDDGSEDDGSEDDGSEEEVEAEDSEDDEEAEDSEDDEEAEEVEKPAKKDKKTKKDVGKKENKIPKKEKNKGSLTKKEVVLQSLKKGMTIEQMAQRIVDDGIDDDYGKNCRVVKAHLRKMGYDVRKETIEKNPVFKEKKGKGE